MSLSMAAAAVAGSALVAGSPIAGAAPAPAKTVTSLLNDPAALLAVKDAAASGYAVPAKLAANCGALQ
ncbi:hypothetical protein [Nakamurella endophytica]|uniref:hypothetical protein n=1 Tax=Nakamurella endophytica TaxID=1748367 RepID=UPI001662E0B8|nr:hypothetical protein [Nakamurella endophytica]